ncbi:MAG: type II toxin-antitoxin system HicA family toxin [Acidobacteria bacterium]|nr:type II toxin-antitoxin system HicA family toxin [Acidobacteriota bacterium]
MSKLPTDLSGQRLRKALERARFICTRQRGSHMVLRRAQPFARVVVPNHKTLRSGTLRQILNQAGLTVERLLELL